MTDESFSFPQKPVSESFASTEVAMMADLNRVILGPGVMCWWLVAVSNLAALAARRKRSRQNYRTNFSSDVIKRRPQDASGRMRTLLCSGIRISNAVGYGETHIHDTDELYRWCMKRFARSGGKSADVSQSSITAQCHGDMLLPGHDPASETWAPVDGSKRNPNERP
ncbi:hypothetical protein IAQ61_006670 [Plenodomus lingam]|uniref:uncharacterized protein n=1 Tax=Leptosphaeria maculans TaxID=5022 RepID=UPI0033197281|nr:hypothetical protein IAQ61_006670 [Plenodomus lingam]